jgi:tRNA(Ile2) C34 agmatinyltransferase TiaS
MADPVPSGSNVSAGTYRCAKCGYELTTGSTKSITMPRVLQRLLAHRERRRRQRQRPGMTDDSPNTHTEKGGPDHGFLPSPDHQNSPGG